MGDTFFTFREFRQDIERTRQAARDGLVFVTDRATAGDVLLTIEEYRNILGREPTLGEMLYDPSVADIDFDLPSRSRESSLRIPDFD